MFSFQTGQFTASEQRRIFFRRLFRRVFLEDWLLKLVALGITLALWFGVTGMRVPSPRRMKNVTLNLRVSSDMEITNSPTQEVEIVVTGDKRRVDPLDSDDLVVSVDLTEVRPGERAIQLSPDNVIIELPSGVRLQEITPNRVLVRLEKVEQREVAVRPETEGHLAEGYEIYSQTVVPAKVRVRGAESFVKSLESVSTERISIEGRREGFTARQVGLNISNPNVTAIDAIVDVVFRIGEKRIERMFVVNVQTGFETKRVSAVLYGARSLLENLRAEDLQVEMFVNEAGETQPRLILPRDLLEQIEIRSLKTSP